MAKSNAPPDDDGDAERRRAAAAARSRSCYRRRTQGLSQYRLDLPDAVIVDLVLEAGFLRVEHCTDHKRVEAALAKFLVSRKKI